MAGSGFASSGYLATNGEIRTTGQGGNAVGVLNPAAYGSGTYTGLWYDGNNNRAVLSSLTGGVAWRNVYVAPNATLVADTVSKGGGSFRIPHPIPSLSATKQLVHSFIEGPYCDLIYRGVATLNTGQSIINIDTYFGMTEGTFVALCKNIQVFVTNQTDWSGVRGNINNNILTITCQDPTSTSTVNWLVVGERQDPHIINTYWTDNNGRPILEPDYIPDMPIDLTSYPVVSGV